jgi:hypothetical protein
VRPPNASAAAYRVIHWHASDSRWNDERHGFDRRDYQWCPRHVGSPHQPQCGRLIPTTQMIMTPKRTPGLIEQEGTCGPTPTHAVQQPTGHNS